MMAAVLSPDAYGTLNASHELRIITHFEDSVANELIATELAARLGDKLSITKSRQTAELRLLTCIDRRAQDFENRTWSGMATVMSQSCRHAMAEVGSAALERNEKRNSAIKKECYFE